MCREKEERLIKSFSLRPNTSFLSVQPEKILLAVFFPTLNLI
jgi:hypothetical protein